MGPKVFYYCCIKIHIEDSAFSNEIFSTLGLNLIKLLKKVNYTSQNKCFLD